MVNYFNKNISFLRVKLGDDVRNFSNQIHISLSDNDKKKYIKGKIISIVHNITGQHVHDFICEVLPIDDHDFFLLIYDMDKKSCNVFYNYDFTHYQKIKDRKKKIEEIFYEQED